VLHICKKRVTSYYIIMEDVTIKANEIYERTNFGFSTELGFGNIYYNIKSK
jgi:hypothetical protein